MSRAKIAAALVLLLAATGCVPGGVTMRPVSDGYYRVTVERCGNSANDADRARVVAELQRSVDKKCAKRGASISAPTFASSFGGYGPIFGECPMVRVDATASCH